MTFTTLTQDIDFLCGTDSVSYTLADKARNINRHIYEAVTKKWNATKGAFLDDVNLAGLPTSTDNLIAGTSTYTIPANALKLLQIAILDNAGNKIKLQNIELSDVSIAWDQFESTPGTPKYYRLIGRKIELKPAPQTGYVTTTNGLIYHYLREIDEFTSSDTTQESILGENLDRIGSLGASLDWLIVHDPQKYAIYKGEYDNLMNLFIKNDLTEEMKTTIRPAHRQANYL